MKNFLLIFTVSLILTACSPVKSTDQRTGGTSEMENTNTSIPSASGAQF